MSRDLKRLLSAGAFLIVLLALGTLAFHLIEGWNWLDALYMTVIIVTTIGFAEVYPLSDLGQGFTIVFALVSFLFFATIVSFLSSYLIEVYLQSNQRRNKMFERISRLKNHIIICGAGKIGRHVVTSMFKNKAPFVVIDSTDYLGDLQENHVQDKDLAKKLLVLPGDPTNEEVLVEAGIERARGIICCLPEDHRNLFIAVSAKKLNSRVKVSSSVIDEQNVSKFNLVGVDDVISGDYVIGRRLTASILNRNVASFIEQTTRADEGAGFAAIDVTVSLNSKLIGKTLAESGIMKSLGLLIFAVKQAQDQDFTLNPSAQTVLHAGDILITLATPYDRERLDKWVNG